MENICRNCKYWDSSDSYNLKNHSFGSCKRADLFWDCTEWIEKDGDYYRELTEKCKNEKAFVQDGSDYRADLITKDSFGCNQFEQI